MMMQLLLGFLLFVIVDGRCENNIQTSSLNSFDYFTKRKENCTWHLSPNYNGSDVMLAIKFSGISKVFINSDGKLYLPDGSLLSDIAACRHYTFSNDTSNRCLSDKVEKYCSNQTMDVVAWPPKISVVVKKKPKNNNKIRLAFTYVFAACPNFQTDGSSVNDVGTTDLLVPVVLGSILAICVLVIGILCTRIYRKATAKNEDKSSREDGRQISTISNQHATSSRKTTQPHACATKLNKEKPKESRASYSARHGCDAERGEKRETREMVDNELYHTFVRK